MKTKIIRSTSRKAVSMFLVLAMIMTVLIQFPTKAYASSVLELQMYNTNTSASTNTLNPNIMLRNTGAEAIDLSTVKIKYYYTKDSNDNNTTQIFICDYCSVGTDNVTSSFHDMSTTTDTADTYVEIGFTSGTLAANSTVQIQCRIYNSQWSNYTQTNDYSFNETDSSYATSSNLPVYVGDTLAFGEEPGTTSSDDPQESNNEKFLVIVANSLYNSISDRLSTYVSDLAVDGYDATIIKVSNSASDTSADYTCATASELKNVIKSYYNQQYKGFVLVGSYPEIPVARWTSNVNTSNVEISDFYYADVDLNGDGIAEASENWVDANNDGIFEASSLVDGKKVPQISPPDMFYGRIDVGGKSSTVEGQAAIINAYFDKVDGFRGNINTIRAQKKSALGFVDDDWSYWYETDAKLRTVFDNVKMIQEDLATNSDVFDSELGNDYYFMTIITHGGPDLLQLHDWNNGVEHNFDYSRDTIEDKGNNNINKAYYIHSFGCCTSKYVEQSGNGFVNQANIGASYLYNNQNTVNVTGVCGSIWNNLSPDYFRNLSNKSIGEAYRLWVKECFEIDVNKPEAGTYDSPSWECAPLYVLLGDPTLRHPLQEKTNTCPKFDNRFKNLSVNLGDQFSLFVDPEDTEGDDITVEMIEAPTGATFNPVINKITWTPTAEQAMGKGEKFALKITDTADNTYTEEFNVYVKIPDFNLSFDATKNQLPIGWNTTSWSNSAIFSSDDVVKHSGANSAKISASSNDHGRFSTGVSVASNTTYRLSGYVKTENVVNNESQVKGANIRVNCDGSTTYISDYLVGDNDWKYVQLEFNTGDSDSAEIICSLGADGNVCTGTAWFDDLTLEEVE